MNAKHKTKRQFITGNFLHAVDAKGRVIVPARWRVGIGTDVYISPNPEGALVVMTEEEFQNVQAKADASDATEDEKSRFKRFLAFNTHVTQMDRQGRITLNDTLLNRGGISMGDQVMLTGKITRFEIYSLNRWKDVQQTLETPFETVSTKIGF